MVKLLWYVRPTLKVLERDAERTVRRGAAIVPGIRMVPRIACSFERVTLQARSRAACRAAQWEARRASRFAEPQALVLPDPAPALTASVWSWDQDGAGLARRALAPRVLPETLARKPLGSGWRLVEALQGVEGEFWRDGGLRASRWWPSQPSDQDWALFARAASPGEDRPARPPVEPADWREWIPPLDLDPAMLRRAFTPERAVAGALAVVLALTVVQLGEISALALQKHRLDARIEANAQTLAEMRLLRSRALQALGEVEETAGLGRPEIMLFALSDLVSSIPDQAGRFVSFRIYRGGVEAQFERTGALDGPAIVAGLEASPWLNGVSISGASADGRLTIRVASVGEER